MWCSLRTHVGAMRCQQKISARQWTAALRSISASSASLAAVPGGDEEDRAGESAASLSKSTGSVSASEPLYYNFKTLHLFPSGPSMEKDSAQSAQPTGGGRRRRLSMSPSHVDDHLPLENTSAVQENDPYKDIRIFRRDMVDSHSARGYVLSVDVPVKKFTDMFCDYDGKRCKLCNETFLQWHSHQGAIPHSGREGLALELMRAYCGTPEEILKMWWHRLHTSTEFNRLPELSHANSHIRKCRLQFLLRFLKDRRIIRDTFNVMQSAQAGAGRTWEFERLEWVGDNVVKYVFNNRLNCIFPVKEGGIRGKLGYAQFMIDGNDGLARAYDFLELQKLTQSDRVVSKFKSDVVETLFGELQLYLWATEIDEGTERYAMPFTKDMYSVRALVSHVMEELAHVMFMYHAEYLLGCIQRIARENQLQFVRADPSLRSRAEAAGAGDQAGGRHSHSLPPSQSGSNVKLSATKVVYNRHSSNGSALFMESTNYEGFKLVVPVGGFLPRPFAVNELATTPNFMPHLQVATVLTESVRRKGWSIPLSHDTEEGGNAGARMPENCSPPYRVFTQSRKRTRAASRLAVPELKDNELVAELL